MPMGQIKINQQKQKPEIDEETGLPIGTEYDKGGKVIDSITNE